MRVRSSTGRLRKWEKRGGRRLVEGKGLVWVVWSGSGNAGTGSEKVGARLGVRVLLSTGELMAVDGGVGIVLGESNGMA